MKTLEQLEKEILKTAPKIRLKGILKKRKETLKEFLIKFFEKWNELTLELKACVIRCEVNFHALQTLPRFKYVMDKCVCISHFIIVPCEHFYEISVDDARHREIRYRAVWFADNIR